MPSNLDQLVTKARIKRWMYQLGYIPECETCGEEFKLGDRIEVKYNKVAKRRHKICMVAIPIIE